MLFGDLLTFFDTGRKFFSLNKAAMYKHRYFKNTKFFGHVINILIAEDEKYLAVYIKYLAVC